METTKKMQQLLSILMAFLVCITTLNAQVGVEILTDGIILPSVDSMLVTGPVLGQVIYDSNTDELRYYDGTKWESIEGLYERVGDLIRQKENYHADDFIFGSEEMPIASAPFDKAYLFDQSKGAMRGGNLLGSNTQESSLGLFSFGYGDNPLASGLGATAFGISPKATGANGATAIGSETEASGAYGATALGYNTIADGHRGATALGNMTEASGDDGATAMGFGTTASGSKGATALGMNSQATGDFGSTAFGLSCGANGVYGASAIGVGCQANGAFGATSIGNGSIVNGSFGSLALGEDCISNGNYGAIAMGMNSLSNGNSCLAVGRYNDALVGMSILITPESPLFIVGNGEEGDLSNAMVVRKDGSATIQTDLLAGGDAFPGASAITDTLFFFDEEKGAIRGGFVNSTYGAPWSPGLVGIASVAFGINNEASGESSTALGARTIAKGDDGAAALGYFTIANADRGMVIGQYNDPIVSAGYNGSDKPLFIIGNGSFATQSNAMVVQANGKIGINTNVPLGHLHIEGEDSFDEPHLRITDNGTDNFIRMRMEREGSASSWTHSARIDDADPTNSLYSLAHHDGTNFSFVTRANGDGDLGISRIPTGNKFEVQGNASKTMAGDWLANSDRRIKTEITEIENSYELLNSLRPVKFQYSQEWKDKNPAIRDQFYYNFIAQEYQEVFPESVQGSGEFLEGDDTEILQIDTYNAQIATIAAVKELIKENTEQREAIELLSSQIKKLNMLVSELTGSSEEIGVKTLQVELNKKDID